MTLLVILMTGFFLHQVKGHPCSTTGIYGIADCQCNFMEACDVQENPKPNLTRYLPTGVDQLGLVEGGQQNLAYLCEGAGAVGILYDCNNRIPLYAATVINGTQLSGKSLGGRPNIKFSLSRELHRSFQQRNGDYKDASKRELCYLSLQNGSKYVVEEDWLKASKNLSALSWRVSCQNISSPRTLDCLTVWPQQSSKEKSNFQIHQCCPPVWSV